VSSYRKLRLSPEEARADAVSAGLEVTSLSSQQGVVTIVARPKRMDHPSGMAGS